MNAAQWLCYRPRVFERGGRNYQVETFGESFPGRFLDAFTAEAEDMWRAAQGQPAVPAWRYASLGSSSSMVLCRCALEQPQQGEARAPVVWALLVPYAAVRAARFELAALAPKFPHIPQGPQVPHGSKGESNKPRAARGSKEGAPASKAYKGPAKSGQGGVQGMPHAPPPPDLASLAVPQPPGPDVSALISRYLESGQVEVRLAPEEALAVFSQVLAELAPRDRMEASFSTTQASTHALSVSPSAAPLAALQPSPEGLARLSLWRLARERLPQAVRDHASLRGPHLPWLAVLLDRSDLAGSYAALLRAMRSHVPQEALGYLRQALEGAIAGLPQAAAAGVLRRLAADGLISEELGVPPLWLARVVLRTGCLSELPGALGPRQLEAPSVPMLMESVQRGPRLAVLAHLARTLSQMPAPVTGTGAGTASARQAGQQPGASLAAACRAAMRPILTEGLSDLNLAPAVVLLLLHEHAARNA